MLSWRSIFLQDHHRVSGSKAPAHPFSLVLLPQRYHRTSFGFTIFACRKDTLLFLGSCLVGHRRSARRHAYHEIPDKVLDCSKRTRLRSLRRVHDAALVQATVYRGFEFSQAKSARPLLSDAGQAERAVRGGANAVDLRLTASHLSSIAGRGALVAQQSASSQITSFLMRAECTAAGHKSTPQAGPRDLTFANDSSQHQRIADCSLSNAIIRGGVLAKSTQRHQNCLWPAQ